MKKYEVPVMKLHQLKSGTVMAASEGKEFVDNSSINTQKYELDETYGPDNLFDN